MIHILFYFDKNGKAHQESYATSDKALQARHGIAMAAYNVSDWESYAVVISSDSVQTMTKNHEALLSKFKVKD